MFPNVPLTPAIPSEKGVIFQHGITGQKEQVVAVAGSLAAAGTLDGNGCTIEDGKTVEDADCVCKTSAAMFNRIWNDGYRPGIMDFMGGSIKSNAPQLLQQLLTAFGK